MSCRDVDRSFEVLQDKHHRDSSCDRMYEASELSVCCSQFLWVRSFYHRLWTRWMMRRVLSQLGAWLHSRAQTNDTKALTVRKMREFYRKNESVSLWIRAINLRSWNSWDFEVNRCVVNFFHMSFVCVLNVEFQGLSSAHCLHTVLVLNRGFVACMTERARKWPNRIPSCDLILLLLIKWYVA